MRYKALTKVDMAIANNVYWDDAFQFGQPDDFTWSFSGVTFTLDIVTPQETWVNGVPPAPVLSLSSAGGTIVVDDPVNRILHLFVSDLTIRSALPIGCYQYDLVMTTTATGERDALMYGSVEVYSGITGISEGV